MKKILVIGIVLLATGTSFWQWQKTEHHMRNSYLATDVIPVAQGPYFRICRSFNPLVETHLVAFPLDNKNRPYKDVFDFTARARPEQKLAYVRAIVKTAEDLDIVKQGYRIIANSDNHSPYLCTHSPHMLHGNVSDNDFQNMLKNNTIQGFCFHIVSDKAGLSATTVTPYSVQNKRERDHGYKGAQTFTECAISRIATESNTPSNILYEDSVYFKSFKDHHPQALFHGLIVSKEKYFSHYELFKNADASTIQNMFQMIVQTGKHTHSKAFRIVSNHGLVAHQDQSVVHFHIVGDEPLGALCYPYDVYYNELTTDLVIDHPKGASDKHNHRPFWKGYPVKASLIDNTMHMDFAASAAVYVKEYM